MLLIKTFKIVMDMQAASTKVSHPCCWLMEWPVAAAAASSKSRLRRWMSSGNKGGRHFRLSLKFPSFVLQIIASNDMYFSLQEATAQQYTLMLLVNWHHGIHTGPGQHKAASTWLSSHKIILTFSERRLDM